jgi:hypothetical protein
VGQRKGNKGKEEMAKVRVKGKGNKKEEEAEKVWDKGKRRKRWRKRRRKMLRKCGANERE